MRRCVWYRNLKNEEAMAPRGAAAPQETNKTNFQQYTVCATLTDLFITSAGPVTLQHVTTGLERADINPLTLELDIHSLAQHLCKMWIFYDQEV